ncbi:uncharacterized protein LOC125942979 [Dermacentor silvarum]|uniref:uncharacterized protein LOC125942979 n=1 Tax=Dermacentor silvarum TaxID=543639 RepID=UPI002101B8DE|nr:uncharacterized protein LOC125942979 [Dermacentor silvarum]
MFRVAFLILSIYAPSAVIATASCPDNDDGWAFMSSTTSPSYLRERNFNTDPQGRDLTQCVSFETTRVDDSKSEIEQDISYYNVSSRQWKTFHKTYKVAPWGTGETKRNYFESPSRTGKPLTYLVLFAGEDCIVAKLLYRSSGQHRACELLVKRGYFKKSVSSRCCDHTYSTSCDTTKQILYKPRKCSTLNKAKKG